jgi:hypothetical protein
MKKMIAKIFRSFRDFRDDLGRTDAAFAYMALCLRHFDSCASLSGDRINYMKEHAAKHSIRLFLPDDTLPQKHVFFSFTVAVHSSWDRFLSELLDELPSFKYPEINKSLKKDGESRLSFFLSMVEKSAPGKLTDLSQPLLNICEYLRLIRNYYVHGLDTPQKECLRLYKQIRENTRDWPTKFGKLSFSSECCEISFDDVLIFTIAAKMLAEDICKKLAPDIDCLHEHPDTKAFIAREKGQISKESFRLFLFDRFGLDRDNANRLSNDLANEALV